MLQGWIRSEQKEELSDRRSKGPVTPNCHLCYKEEMLEGGALGGFRPNRVEAFPREISGSR